MRRYINWNLRHAIVTWIVLTCEILAVALLYAFLSFLGLSKIGVIGYTSVFAMILVLFDSILRYLLTSRREVRSINTLQSSETAPPNGQISKDSFFTYWRISGIIFSVLIIFGGFFVYLGITHPDEVLYKAFQGVVGFGALFLAAAQMRHTITTDSDPSSSEKRFFWGSILLTLIITGVCVWYPLYNSKTTGTGTLPALKISKEERFLQKELHSSQETRFLLERNSIPLMENTTYN